MYSNFVNIFLTLITVLVITESKILKPYVVNADESQFKPRSDDKYLNQNSVLLNPLTTYYGNNGRKVIYSVYLPVESKPVNDLMESESNFRPSVVDFSRRSSAKTSKQFEKAFGNQFTDVFGDFGEAFGHSFKDFDKDFGKNLGKTLGNNVGKVGKPSGGRKKKPVFGSGFFKGGSNIGKRFKSFFKRF